MNKNTIIIIIVAALVLVGGYFILTNMQSPVTQNNTSEQFGETTGGVAENTPKTYEANLTNSGFSPAELTIHVGDTVVFKNQSSGGMWVGSAMHPIHAAYSGTSMQSHCPDADNNDFDQCAPSQTGNSWSFTFTKPGMWGYHNHVQANQFGKIIVE